MPCTRSQTGASTAKKKRKTPTTTIKKTPTMGTGGRPPRSSAAKKTKLSTGNHPHFYPTTRRALSKLACEAIRKRIQNGASRKMNASVTFTNSDGEKKVLKFGNFLEYKLAEEQHFELPLAQCILYKGRPVLPCDIHRFGHRLKTFIHDLLLTHDSLLEGDVDDMAEELKWATFTSIDISSDTLKRISFERIVEIAQETAGYQENEIKLMTYSRLTDESFQCPVDFLESIIVAVDKGRINSVTFNDWECKEKNSDRVIVKLAELARKLQGLCPDDGNFGPYDEPPGCLILTGLEFEKQPERDNAKIRKLIVELNRLREIAKGHMNTDNDIKTLRSKIIQDKENVDVSEEAIDMFPFEELLHETAEVGI